MQIVRDAPNNSVLCYGHEQARGYGAPHVLGWINGSTGRIFH